MEWRPRTKRKRWARRGPTPNELFPALASTAVAAALSGDALWLPADDRVAKLFNGTCIGTAAGGARAAAEAAAAVAAAGVPSPLAGPPRVAVRLALEEGFFLAYVLGTLTAVVATPGGGEEEAGGGAAPPPAAAARVLSVDGLWDACVAARPGFAASYVAYHHYRCKGWTVRSGLRYGTDYVLYAGHPAAAHADVCVLVLEEGAAASGEGEGVGGKDRARASAPASPLPPGAALRPARPLTWLDVEIGNRLACQVGKRLLLAHVLVDGGGGRVKGGAADPNGGGAATPPPPAPLRPADLLARVTVEERLVERWVPDADREH